MAVIDRKYFYKRAEDELEMAQAAHDPAAVRAHYTLAAHYLDRAYGGHDHLPASPEEIRSRIPLSPKMP